jgi:hypothetical protein
LNSGWPASWRGEVLGASASNCYQASTCGKSVYQARYEESTHTIVYQCGHSIIEPHGQPACGAQRCSEPVWYYSAAMTGFRAELPRPFALPKRLRRLNELAYNLWWTWNPEAVRVLGRLDYSRWERLGHNPIRFLREIKRRRLNQAAKDPDYLGLYDSVFSSFDSYFALEPLALRHPNNHRPIAYFSMELDYGDAADLLRRPRHPGGRSP